MARADVEVWREFDSLAACRAEYGELLGDGQIGLSLAYLRLGKP